MMRYFRLLMIFYFFSGFNLLMAQDAPTGRNDSNWNVGLEGMAGFSVGQNFYAFNVGGPSLFLVLNENLKIGAGALPSLYFLNGKAGARLGVAPRVDYKNLAFFAPFFHRDTADDWVWSVGMGYKFHRKK